MPHILDSESDFHCFACAGVNEKYHCLNIGDDTPLFGDKNVKDMKDAHAVDSDEEVLFAPDYKRVKTAAPPRPPPPPSPPPPPPQPLAIFGGTGPPRTARRTKRVPKPTLLEKALASVQAGKEHLELMSLNIEADMDRKLAALLLYVSEHPNVVSVELQVLS